MNSNNKSYYDVLGVQPNATPDEIRSSFRRLAKKYHPDRNSGDLRAEEKFKDINEAYRILSDPSLRMEFHEKEKIRVKSKKSAKGESTFHVSDLFKNVFKGGFGTESDENSVGIPRKGQDITVKLSMELNELTQGVEKVVTFKRDIQCKVCSGSGQKNDSSTQQCSICLGIGEVLKVKAGKSIFVKCNNCKGSGKVIRDRCMHCGGRTVVKGSAKIRIEIPAGSKNNNKIKLKGEGNAGINGGKTGDIVVILLEKESEYYQKDGNDLIYEYPINIFEIAQGGEIEVPTPTGPAKLKIAPNIKNGQLLKVRGRGITNVGSAKKGDLFVKLVYFIPEDSTEVTREMLSKLVDRAGWKPTSDEKGYFKKK
jgi:molecular chaperone DnaJ